MTTKALFVKLEAKPGKENEVAKFLRDGQGLVQQEPETTAWFGIRLGPSTFAIFDAFADDAGRDAHLSGKVAKALMEKAPELLAEPPKIEKADVLADRLLGWEFFWLTLFARYPEIARARASKILIAGSDCAQDFPGQRIYLLCISIEFASCSLLFAFPSQRQEIDCKMPSPPRPPIGIHPCL
jgi:quinol monooxygenase YgiN